MKLSLIIAVIIKKQWCSSWICIFQMERYQQQLGISNYFLYLTDWWLGLMILGVFSKLNSFMFLWVSRAVSSTWEKLSLIRTSQKVLRPSGVCLGLCREPQARLFLSKGFRNMCKKENCFSRMGPRGRGLKDGLVLILGNNKPPPPSLP